MYVFKYILSLYPFVIPITATAPKLTKSPASSMDRHVAVLGFPTHAANLFKLLRRLACAAPTTIFSLFNTARAHSTIFSAQHPHGIPNLRVYDVADGVPEDRVLSATHQERIVLFLKATPGNFRDAIEVAEAEIGRKEDKLPGEWCLFVVHRCYGWGNGGSLGGY